LDDFNVPENEAASTALKASKLPITITEMRKILDEAEKQQQAVDDRKRSKMSGDKASPNTGPRILG
jgi:hypothetical protein